MTNSGDLSLKFEKAFHETGHLYDPTSNVLQSGEGKWVDLDSPNENLVTGGVASCVALVAVDPASGKAGLWHIHHTARSEYLYDKVFPDLMSRFDPALTEIYLIGGKKRLSEGLALSLDDLLAKAGFQVSDTALLLPQRVDVAVNRRGEVFVKKENTQNRLLYKAAHDKKLTPLYPGLEMVPITQRPFGPPNVTSNAFRAG